MLILNKPTLFLLVLLAFLASNIGIAQQAPQYTNYMYNPSAINPAFAGFRNTLSSTFIHRSQWLGIDGAPATDAFSVHSPLKNEQTSLGLNITNDKVGATSQISFNGDLAYSIYTENSNITFGTKIGLQRYSLDNTKIKLEDQTDPDFINFRDVTGPQIGFGFMFETANLILGVSVPNILENKYSKSKQDNYIAGELRNYYLSAEYIFELSYNTVLRTTALSKIVLGAPAQLDVSANFLLYQKLTLAYRPNVAVSGLLGYQLSDTFMLGCAYDRDITRFTTVNSGSAEFILRYEFKNKLSNKRILNPRIF